jgi:hypothetical protein
MNPVNSAFALSPITGGGLKEHIRAATRVVGPVARLAAAFGYREMPMTDAKLTQKQEDLPHLRQIWKYKRGVLLDATTRQR